MSSHVMVVLRSSNVQIRKVAALALLLSLLMRSSSIDFYTFVLAFHTSEMLHQPLYIMCNSSDCSDSPDFTSTWLSGSVCTFFCLDVVNTSRLRFQFSSSTWWIHRLTMTSRMVAKWCGWLRYVPLRVLVEFLLICLICS